MCFSLVALGGVPVRINDPKCVAKTFPDYFERFAQITLPAQPVARQVAGAWEPASDTPPGPRKRRSSPSTGRRPRARGRWRGGSPRRSGSGSWTAGRSTGWWPCRPCAPGSTSDDRQALAGVARELDCSFQGETVLLAGEPVTEALRTEEVSAAASRVAGLQPVRAALLERQRAFRRPPGLVADGRDMGSVVFPQAQLKVFLTASPEERARRRHKQLMEKGIDARLPTLLQDINERDARDASREVAPLVRCEDARVLDTTGLSVDQAAQQVLDWFEEIRSK